MQDEVPTLIMDAHVKNVREASEANAAAASNVLGSIHCLEECAGILASGGGPLMLGEDCAEQLGVCLDSIVENTQVCDGLFIIL